MGKKKNKNKKNYIEEQIKEEEIVLTAQDMLTDYYSLVNRHIYICRDIDAYNLTDVISMILSYEEEDMTNDIPYEQRIPIKIHINTRGGVLTEAFRLYDVIRSCSTPVITIGEGAVLSAGLIIFLAGHKKISYKNTQFLYHEGYTAFEGTTPNFVDYTKENKRVSKKIHRIFFENTNLTKKQFKKIKKLDYWFSANKGFKLGLIDEIV